jgi:formate--tetrahydrofolate ligase
MKSDIEIAHEVQLLPIMEVAEKTGILPEEVILCGSTKAKLSLGLLDRLRERPNGKLVLITAMTPTPYGEGKTTTAIGLSMALNRLQRPSIVTLREPSLGPVFGVKGGAAGGGYAQVIPMEEINLHFTGDMHAVTSAHNLVAAMIDNHMYQGNGLGIDHTQIVFPRAMDMNDRALRDIIVALGGVRHGLPREDEFIITAASEVMAVLSLSKNLDELKGRLGRIIVAYTRTGEPVTIAQIGAQGAMTALLVEALRPNLVQTTEHTPTLVHCGPFANIAHGTNSIIATEMALKCADVVVTETGFGSDLGAEKFFHIVAPQAGFKVHGVVVVATLRALKFHGGTPKDGIDLPSVPALEKGFPNLLKHVENMKLFGVPTVVVLNRFTSDTDEEVASFRKVCSSEDIPCAVSSVFQHGGQGGEEMAALVLEQIEGSDGHFSPLYQADSPVQNKIDTIARKIYGAQGVIYQLQARRDLQKITSLGFSHLPLCMAKTPSSLSDDPKKRGVPAEFDITVREVNISAGAEFIVPMAGDVRLMPGLPKRPAAMDIDVDARGRISGLF